MPSWPTSTPTPGEPLPLLPPYCGPGIAWEAAVRPLLAHNSRGWRAPAEQRYLHAGRNNLSSIPCARPRPFCRAKVLFWIGAPLTMLFAREAPWPLVAPCIVLLLGYWLGSLAECQLLPSSELCPNPHITSPLPHLCQQSSLWATGWQPCGTRAWSTAATRWPPSAASSWPSWVGGRCSWQEADACREGQRSVSYPLHSMCERCCAVLTNSPLPLHAAGPIIDPGYHEVCFFWFGFALLMCGGRWASGSVGGMACSGGVRQSGKKSCPLGTPRALHALLSALCCPRYPCRWITLFIFTFQRTVSSGSPGQCTCPVLMLTRTCPSMQQCLHAYLNMAAEAAHGCHLPRLCRLWGTLPTRVAACSLPSGWRRPLWAASPGRS